MVKNRFYKLLAFGKACAQGAFGSTGQRCTATSRAILHTRSAWTNYGGAARAPPAARRAPGLTSVQAHECAGSRMINARL